jgi:hypothetical protein
MGGGGFEGTTKCARRNRTIRPYATGAAASDDSGARVITDTHRRGRAIRVAYRGRVRRVLRARAVGTKPGSHDPLSDGIRARRFPIVNVALIVANLAVWILQRAGAVAFRLADERLHARQLGSHPGNMLFLAVFGKNVEDALGRLRYLAFYLAGGFVATMTQTVVTLVAATAADAHVPQRGASGAIAAYYVALSAHARPGARRRLPRADPGPGLPRQLVPVHLIEGSSRTTSACSAPAPEAAARRSSRTSADCCSASERELQNV